jgi:hypothetical protein
VGKLVEAVRKEFGVRSHAAGNPVGASR